MSLSAQKASLFGTNKDSKTGGSKAATTAAPAAAPAAPAPAPVKVSKTAHMTAPVSFTGGLVSPAMKQKFVNDAKSLEERGANFLKTSMFQWKADHLGAGPLYEQAGDAYVKAEDYEQAQRCYAQAMESHEAVGLLSSSAMAAAKVGRSIYQRQRRTAQNSTL